MSKKIADTINAEHFNSLIKCGVINQNSTVEELVSLLANSGGMNYLHEVISKKETDENLIKEIMASLKLLVIFIINAKLISLQKC